MHVEILERSLLPFTREVMPQKNRLMQDNDPKHCSKVTKKFFTEKDMNWWKTPLSLQIATQLKICGMNLKSLLGKRLSQSQNKNL